jgi:hypothetical protein
MLIEKPMATTVAEVDQLGKLAESKNLIAMVGHTFLYNPAVRHIKKISIWASWEISGTFTARGSTWVGYALM